MSDYFRLSAKTTQKTVNMPIRLKDTYGKKIKGNLN